MKGWNTRIRLWHKEKKEMLPSAPIYKANFSAVDTTVYEIMFSTGLKDCNGKEIYEGDKLTEDGDFTEGIVAWWDDEAQFFLVDDSGYASDSDGAYEPSQWLNYEIIGNIFEDEESP